ncbi:uncharacterized protein LOC128209659 [Mya arenaria]|uniref:uncharacterized protein LOC128209659 n=1 Tax=Mya arenaria TaxID=6604 RepID=UPI0022E4D137|nr:uncharacterized protein LOC128209659 [Mya arenaria]
MEDYMGLVERIKIPDERHKMVQALSAIGGVNVRDNVKNILEKLMSNELISLFNMKGNNNKLSFKSSAICGIVIASAMKTKVKEGMTEHEVMLAVQTCLKYAPDRRGGGGRKKTTP